MSEKDFPEENEARHKPRIGLALGGGVARGWAHIGAIRALERHGIRPDIIAGSSIGAMVGGSYAAGYLDQLEGWARGLTKMGMVRVMDFRIRSSGLIGGNRLLALMRHYMKDMRIEDLPTPFVAVTTDLVTGHEVWLRHGDLATALKASFALPGVFPPVKIARRWLTDGALVNPVPVSVCQALGADMTIAINLNADMLGKTRSTGDIPRVAGFDILNDEASEGIAARIRNNPFTKRMFRREADTPSLFGVMVSALNIVQDRLTRSRLAGDPPDVNINPRLGAIGLFEFHRAAEIIQMGEEAVERAMPELMDALSVFHVAGREPTGAPAPAPGQS